MIGYFSREELEAFGFAGLGENVRISRTSTLYNCQNITIGSNVRIDNFCTIALSGPAKLFIGDYVHISAYNFLNGAADITIANFVTTAPYVRIFSSSDDYSGSTMTGAVVPRELIGTQSGSVMVNEHCIIGVGSSVMPGVQLGLGTSVGGHSFVRDNTESMAIVAGVPAKKIGERKQDFLELAERIKK